MARAEWFTAALSGLPVGLWRCDEGSGAPEDEGSTAATLDSGSNSWTTDGTHGDVLVIGAGAWSTDVEVDGSVSITQVVKASTAAWYTLVSAVGADQSVTLYALDGTGAEATAANTDGVFDFAGAQDAAEDIDDWTVLTSVLDGDDLTLYVNGASVATDTLAEGVLTQTLTVGFGGYDGGAVGGLCAGFAVFDWALTPTEVSDQYDAWAAASGPPPAPSTATWDDFDRTDAVTLGAASVVDLSWQADLGAWEIDTNKARVTSYTADHAAARLPASAAGLPAPVAASLTIDVPASGTWFAGLFIGATTHIQVGGVATLGVGAGIASSGDLVTARWLAAETVDFQDSTSVDTTAGPHDLALSAELDLETAEWTIRAWWDDTLYLTTTWGTEGPWPEGFEPEWHDVSIVVYGADGELLAFDDLGVALAPLEVPGAAAPVAAGGGVVNWPYDPDVIFAPSVPAPLLRGGVLVWPSRPTEPVYAPSVAAPPLLGGVHHIYSDTPNPPPPPAPDETPWPEGYQYGPPTSKLEVAGWPWATAVSCRPQLSEQGQGSFTVVPPGPGEGTAVTYTSGGAAVFRGVVAEVTTVVAAPGEEAEQLVTASTPSKLFVDWSRTTVYPDFGAGDPIRVGQPAQDDRIWGWPMNGLNVPGLTWTTSIGGDNARYGTPEEIFPLPDNWPDNRAQWMWTTEVDVASQPEGWSFFRMPFGLFPGTYSLFVCAWDYARVYVDGVLVATVEQGGTTKRVELDFDWDFHLIAIEAYARGGGPAGVLVSLLQRHQHAFGGTDCYSRGGWKALERPTVSMRATPGRVLRRLVEEAAARGAPAGAWSCSFTDDADSAGNPWPKGEDAPLLTTKVGATYWDVAKQFAEALIDFYPAPGADVFHAFVKDEGGVSRGMPWTHTVDAAAITERAAI
jgi:hypothetical protein